MRQKKHNGFTMIEVLVSILLIGIAIVSLIGANISFTKANGAGSELSTAEFLIEQIREKTVMTAYGDLASLDGVTYSPPVSADGAALPGFDVYSQRLTVENVSGNNFDQVVADGSSDFVKVTVDVFLNSRKLSSDNWIRANY